MEGHILYSIADHATVDQTVPLRRLIWSLLFVHHIRALFLMFTFSSVLFQHITNLFSNSISTDFYFHLGIHGSCMWSCLTLQLCVAYTVNIAAGTIYHHSHISWIRAGKKNIKIVPVLQLTLEIKLVCFVIFNNFTLHLEELWKSYNY